MPYPASTGEIEYVGAGARGLAYRSLQCGVCHILHLIGAAAAAAAAGESVM